MADPVCPSPMTSLTIDEVRQAFAGSGMIMRGVSSIALLPESMSNREFEGYMEGFFAAIGRGDHLILGMSDTSPPGAYFARILRIGELARIRLRARAAVGPDHSHGLADYTTGWSVAPDIARGFANNLLRMSGLRGGTVFAMCAVTGASVSFVWAESTALQRSRALLSRDGML